MKQPNPAQLKHTQRLVHRDASGQFKEPPAKPVKQATPPALPPAIQCQQPRAPRYQPGLDNDPSWPNKAASWALKRMRKHAELDQRPASL